MRFTKKISSLSSGSVPKTSWDQNSPSSTQHVSTSSVASSTSSTSSSQSTSLVKIRWIDASTSGGPGWVSLEDAMEFAEQDPPIMETVGYVLHEVNDPKFGYIVMTDTLGEDECSSVHKIPYVMIIERSTL